MISSFLGQLSTLEISTHADKTNFEIATYVPTDSSCLAIALQVRVENELCWLLVGSSTILIH